HSNIERMENSTTLNANNYNVTASADQTRFGNCQDYNVQAPPPPQSYGNNTVNIVDHQIRQQFVFFFRPYNDFYFYHVKCEETSSNNIIKMYKSLINKESIMQFNENEIIFFHTHQRTNRFYQVTCEIVSPFF